MSALQALVEAAARGVTLAAERAANQKPSLIEREAEPFRRSLNRQMRDFSTRAHDAQAQGDMAGAVFWAHETERVITNLQRIEDAVAGKIQAD